MFEFSVACKYLLPRWRQLSVSIISIISILVISLVVWLIVVFFSVTNGLEQGWTQKLISLTAPVRLTPTEAFYNSYYYQIDTISAASEYTPKSISEKLAAAAADPYDPESDEEIPPSWPAADRNPDGSVKDIVKAAFSSINELKDVSGLHASPFEVAYANLRLRLQRDFPGMDAGSVSGMHSPAMLSNAVWVGSLDPANRNIQQTMLPARMEDLRNVLNLLNVSNENIVEDAPGTNTRVGQKALQNALQSYFNHVSVTQLKTPPEGWIIPKAMLPPKGKLQACAIFRGQDIHRIVIPASQDKLKSLCETFSASGLSVLPGTLSFEQSSYTFTAQGKEPRKLMRITPFLLMGGIAMDAKLIPDSLTTAALPNKVKFEVHFNLQGNSIQGTTYLGNLDFSQATVQTLFNESPEMVPQWLHYQQQANDASAIAILGSDDAFGEGILLPRSFRDAGVLIGDRGYVSYYTPTASSMQEQRVPIHVAGFYDPGIIPIGGKFVLANPELASLMRAAYQQEDHGMGTGINIRFDNLAQADKVKAALQQAFKQQGIDKYWNIETYREFEFTRDIIQQLRSEKNLFTLIATVIIIVACSNIISMLIILVNDKKMEIGILRSMGASSASIAFIFGLCGVVMGLLGSLIGTLVAIITLKNLSVLINFISRMQGYEMFNAHVYGDVMPHELSYEALAFVLIATAVISLLAGIVPAVKASLLKPSAILKAE